MTAPDRRRDGLRERLAWVATERGMVNLTYDRFIEIVEEALAEAAPPSPLPPVTPIPGLDVKSANDLLSPESKAELDANLRDIARTQRQALASAATMPLGAAPPSGALDWTAGHLALAERMHEVWTMTGRSDPLGHDMEAWRGFALALLARIETTPVARLTPEPTDDREAGR
jgi:hypothetical protein